MQTAVGLQSRVSPTLLYMKEQIETGYVGEMLACHVTTMRDGALHGTRPGGTMPLGARHVVGYLSFPKI